MQVKINAKYYHKLKAAKRIIAQRSDQSYAPLHGSPLFPVPTREARSLAEVGQQYGELIR